MKPISYARCNKCATVNWRSPNALREFGYGCRKCGANETRFTVSLSILERLYLLRWFWWEMNVVNKDASEGDPEPRWYVNPKNLLTFWKVYRLGTAKESS